MTLVTIRLRLETLNKPRPKALRTRAINGCSFSFFLQLYIMPLLNAYVLWIIRYRFAQCKRYRERKIVCPLLFSSGAFFLSARVRTRKLATFVWRSLSLLRPPFWVLLFLLIFVVASKRFYDIIYLSKRVVPLPNVILIYE